MRRKEFGFAGGWGRREQWEAVTLGKEKKGGMERGREGSLRRISVAEKWETRIRGSGITTEFAV